LRVLQYFTIALIIGLSFYNFGCGSVNEEATTTITSTTTTTTAASTTTTVTTTTSVATTVTTTTIGSTTVTTTSTTTTTALSYSWEALGSGVDDTVYALFWSSNGYLIIGGDFTTGSNNIASFEGGVYRGYASGPGGRVRAITEHSGILMAAGDLAHAVRYFNGSWNDRGGALIGYGNCLVDAAGGSGPNLCVGGTLTNEAAFINRFAYALNSNDFVGGGTTNWGTVEALTFDSGSQYVFAGGIGLGQADYFIQKASVNNLGGWSSITNQPNGPIYALAANNGLLYFGGTFDQISPTTNTSNIAKYNISSETFSALDSGIAGPVYALAVDTSNGLLFAGGYFSSASGTSANNIAVWDGSSWHALNAGTNGTVEAIAIDPQGNVYVGGHFTSAGGISANHIAKLTRD